MLRPRLLALLLALLSCTLALPVRANTAAADSLDIKIGQMLMVGFRGANPEEAGDILLDIADLHLGGVVLFDYDVAARSPHRNIESPRQVARLVETLQEKSQRPLFIAIDQEGGRVSRLKPAKGFAPSLSARSLGRLDRTDSTRAAARDIAWSLRELGITMNLAPVVDLDVNPENPVIGKLERSYSADPAVVTRHATIVARELERVNIVPVLKHFPGHGSSRADSHLGFTDVSGSWSEIELEPYRRMLADGYAGAIMTAHVFNERLDPAYPATLSKATIAGLLRGRLGFDGVVVSDDLQMKAIADHYGLREAILRALDAEVDILLFANNSVWDPDIARKAAAIMRSLVEEGAVSSERIDRSWKRIITLKQHYLTTCR